MRNFCNKIFTIFSISLSLCIAMEEGPNDKIEECIWPRVKGFNFKPINWDSPPDKDINALQDFYTNYSNVSYVFGETPNSSILYWAGYYLPSMTINTISKVYETNKPYKYWTIWENDVGKMVKRIEKKNSFQEEGNGTATLDMGEFPDFVGYISLRTDPSYDSNVELALAISNNFKKDINEYKILHSLINNDQILQEFASATRIICDAPSENKNLIDPLKNRGFQYQGIESFSPIKIDFGCCKIPVVSFLLNRYVLELNTKPKED